MHCNAPHINATLGLARQKVTQWGMQPAPEASWMLFKSLCSKVSVGSRKVRIFHPSLSPHIDPLVIRRGLLCDSAPALCLHRHPRPSGSSEAMAGHGSASQSPPLAPPSSAGIKSQAGPLPVALFPVELPSFFSGSLSGDGSSRAWQWDAWALSYCTSHAHNTHTWDHHFISGFRWNGNLILISLAQLLSFHFFRSLKV